MLKFIHKLKNILILTIISIVIFLSIQFLLLYFLDTTNTYPIILWWTPFLSEESKVIDCDNQKCILTKNRNYRNDPKLDAILFYGSKIDVSDLPTPKNNVWAIFHEESPKNLAWFLHADGRNIFDIQSTFSRNSDFPLTLQYLEDIDLLIDLKYYKNVEYKNKFLDKYAPIIYIQSSCNTPFERDLYVEQLMKYIQIDSYGNCLNNKPLPEELLEIDPLDLYNEKLLDFISHYKFVISFENSLCNDYITEKLWRPLIVGSIPIYFGSPSVENWLPNKNSAILVKNFVSVADLAVHIQKINENNDLYNSYLSHKINRTINNDLLEYTMKNNGITNGDHTIPAFECFVCREIHRNFTGLKSYSNIYDCPKPNSTWDNYWEFGKCQAKILKNITNRNGVTNELFEEMWMEKYRNKDC